MTIYDPAEGLTKRVLVAGATGAIGRSVCRELVLHGYRVLGLARTDEAADRLPYAVVPILGDIRNPKRWEPAIAGVDVVINLAIPGDIGQGKQERVDAERDAEELAAILDRVCDTIRRAKKLMIHTFGALLYAPGPDGTIRETSPITHGRGFGIRHAKTYPVLERHRKRGLRAMSVNPGFVYGRGGWFERGVLDPMSRGQSAYLGDGTQTMHYIEASDAAAGYRLAIERGLEGDDYLLGDDHASTLGEFTRLVAREVGAPPPVSIPEEDAIAMLGSWTYEAYTYCPKIDSTRARERLGWSPKYRTIEQGVPAVIRAWKRERSAPEFASGIGAVRITS